jgi:hypothetical protein
MLWLGSILAVLILPLVPAASTGRDLSFSDRVAARMAIDRLYHHHTIGASGPYDELSGEDAARLRVQTWMLQEAALRRFWNVGITAQHLDQEMDRIERDTMMPERLHELFEALGHDRLLIREVVARPVLADRLLRMSFAFDAARHALARKEAEALAASLAEGRTRVSDPHPFLHWIGRDIEGRRPVQAPEGSLEVGTLTEEVDAFVIPVRAAGSGMEPPRSSIASPRSRSMTGGPASRRSWRSRRCLRPSQRTPRARPSDAHPRTSGRIPRRPWRLRGDPVTAPSGPAPT